MSFRYIHFFHVPPTVEILSINLDTMHVLFSKYSVVLNERAARLLIFENFSYLHALIKYLHVLLIFVNFFVYTDFTLVQKEDFDILCWGKSLCWGTWHLSS